MAQEEEKKVEETVVATDAAQEDLNQRVDAFLKDYSELVTKHGIDFATYPMFTPDGKGGFQVVTRATPVDVKKQPVKSDFMATE